jgi:hypothetical protein
MSTAKIKPTRARITNTKAVAATRRVTATIAINAKSEKTKSLHAISSSSRDSPSFPALSSFLQTVIEAGPCSKPLSDPSHSSLMASPELQKHSHSKIKRLKEYFLGLFAGKMITLYEAIEFSSTKVGSRSSHVFTHPE